MAKKVLILFDSTLHFNTLRWNSLCSAFEGRMGKEFAMGAQVGALQDSCARVYLYPSLLQSLSPVSGYHDGMISRLMLLRLWSVCLSYFMMPVSPPHLVCSLNSETFETVRLCRSAPRMIQTKIIPNVRQFFLPQSYRLRLCAKHPPYRCWKGTLLDIRLQARVVSVLATRATLRHPLAVILALRQR